MEMLFSVTPRSISKIGNHGSASHLALDIVFTVLYYFIARKGLCVEQSKFLMCVRPCDRPTVRPSRSSDRHPV